MQTHSSSHTPRVLVIGAGGFAGGFIVAEGLKRNFEVWAAVRQSTSQTFLQDERINFVILDFDDPDAMADTLASALPAGEKWDYIVYNLGATKALSFADFNRINHDYLQSIINILMEKNLVPQKFLYISSLSVLGPGDEKNYTPFTTRSIPTPDTRYGASKLKAEMVLASGDIPYIIFRCTGIYGPHERDYYLMFKSISMGLDFTVGFRKQLLTFIYISDLCTAIYDALLRAPVGKTYLIAEDRAYTQAEFRKIAAEAIGKRFVIPVKAPIWLLRLICSVNGLISRFTHKPATLNPDKFNIMRQRNWSADISDAKADFGFNPATPLSLGVRQAVEWYRQAGWLKERKSSK